MKLLVVGGRPAGVTHDFVAEPVHVAEQVHVVGLGGRRVDEDSSGLRHAAGLGLERCDYARSVSASLIVTLYLYYVT